MQIAPIDSLFDTPKDSNTSGSIEKTPRHETQQEFLKHCESYWKTSHLENYFNKGVLLGGSDNKDFNIDVFLKRFFKVLEERIKEKMSEDNKPLNEIQDVLNVFKSNSNVLKEVLKRNQINLGNDELIAIYHGFMSSFILKEKEL
jgi:hypothetical protein